MRILVTFAVEDEFAPWRKLREFGTRDYPKVACYETRIADMHLDVLLTGIGGKKAWVEATKIIWNGDVDFCISSGLAGALRPDHRPGETLVARKVRSVDWNRTIHCDSWLVNLASECGAKVVDAFHSEDRVVVDSAEKRALGSEADAVEMESGEVLFEAAAFGARGVAIRGISDTVEEDLPLDFNRVTNASGDVSIPRVMREVFRNPGAIPALIRFGHQSHEAAERLAAFLDEYVQRLSRTAVDARPRGASAT